MPTGPLIKTAPRLKFVYLIPALTLLLLILLMVFAYFFLKIRREREKSGQEKLPVKDELDEEIERRALIKQILIKEEVLSDWEEALEMAPTNPDKVKAVCFTTGEEIVSGEPTSCSDPEFVWSGAEPKEPGAKIIGYYVYFGTDNNASIFGESGFNEVVDPVSAGKYLTENRTRMNEGKDFSSEAGKTYYLMVRSKSDSKEHWWSFGVDIIDKESLKIKLAEVLFEYKYEE